MLAIVFLPAINPHRRLDLKISVFRYRNSQIYQNFWLNLQNRFDLEVTEDQLADRLDKEIHVINTEVAYRKMNRDFIETAEGTD